MVGDSQNRPESGTPVEAQEEEAEALGPEERGTPMENRAAEVPVDG